MKKYYWISMSPGSHFKNLKLKSGNAEVQNMSECIYFDYDTEKQDAEDFLDKMKQFIMANYPRAKSEKWW